MVRALVVAVEASTPVNVLQRPLTTDVVLNDVPDPVVDNPRILLVLVKALPELSIL
jgi:hypothetical protein